MVPQQPAYYASAAASAPPLFGNPTFPSVGFAQQHQCLPVQVGIPAGAAVYGPGAQQAAHMGNTAMGPPPYSSNKNQTSFVQGMGSDNAFAAPPNGNLSGQWQGQSRPPRSPPNPSYPPGFEPRHNNAAMWGPSEPRHNSVAMGGPSVPHPHPHPHPHAPHPHPHPHPHPQPHPQPQPQPSCQGHAHVHPHPHPHPHPQPQPGPQPQTSCQGIPQQEQSCHYTSMPFPTTPNAYLPNFQVCDTNGTAIGVPVMGTPAYMDATCTVPPPSIFQNNQPVQPWQPSYPENSASTESVPQSFKSTFAFTKYFRGNQAHTLTPPKLERQLCSNRWQPPKTQRIDQPHSGIPADHSRSSKGQSCSSTGGNRAHLLPPSKPETQPCMEGWKPSNVERINQSQAVPLNGFLRSDTSYPCSVMEGNKLPHVLSPSKVPMQPCANGRQPPNTYRNNQPQSNEQLKVGTGHPSSAVELNGFDCSGKTQEIHVNGQQESQLYKSSEFRGNAFKRGMGKRPDQQQLRCDPCERTFTSSEYLEAHLSSHIKCGEKGCMFEASGKIIKEHKVVEHGKTSAPTTFIGRKALALRSMEDKEEVTRWREERKKNYPTSANIMLKAEEKKKREAEGEFVDEESQKRRQRMSEVLARQKELGFQAAEIPAYYFSVRHDRRQRPNRVHRNIELKQQGMVKKVTTMADSRAGDDNFERENLVRNKRTCPTADSSEMSHKVAHTEPIKVSALQEKTSEKVSKLENDIQDIKSQHASFCCGIESQNNADKELHRHCDNREVAGSRFLPRRKRRKRHSGSDTTNAWPRPTLLSKLLDYDIQKEKSYLLQCCRFIVNNSFLQQWSPAALKHFDWIEAGKPSSTDGMHATLLLDPATRKEMHTLSDSEDSAPGKERHTLSDSQDSAIGKERARVFKREETILEVSKSSLANTKDPIDVDGLMKDAQRASVLVSQDVTTKKEELDLIIEEQPSRNLSQPCLENDVGDADSKSNFTAQNQSVVDRLVSGIHTSVLLESQDSHNQFIVDRLASGTHPSVSLWEQPNTDAHSSYHDMDAGEVASGISGSIVDDEDDVSQYMNFNASGTDSGSCYD